jgi:hypothetical protein
MNDLLERAMPSGWAGLGRRWRQAVSLVLFVLVLGACGSNGKQGKGAGHFGHLDEPSPTTREPGKR